MRVIELENILMTSVNQKYIVNRRTGRLVLSPKYRKFKDTLIAACKKIAIKKPYQVIIHMETYLDIDNPLKCILDSLGEVIENDRHIEELHVYKKVIKRGEKGKLVVTVNNL